MVSVIVIAAQNPSAFKVDDSVKVGALIYHWSANNNCGNLNYDHIRLVTSDGTTIEKERPVKNIPVGPFGTRIVRVVSNKFVVIHKTSIRGTESKSYEIPIFLSCTGAELHKDVSHETNLKSTEFRLRIAKINEDSEIGDLLLDDVSLESQGIASESRLLVEHASTGTVHCVSRTRKWTRQVPFFRDQPVKRVLEPGISTSNQRILVDGQVIDVNPDLPLNESGMISSDNRLEFTIVFREAVILDMRWSEAMVWVWPEEQVSCLLKFRDDHKEGIVKRNTRKAETLWEDDEKSKNEADPLLMSDVNYPGCAIVKRGPEEKAESNAEKDCLWTVPITDGHSVYYRGFPLDLNVTFADACLPPYALVTIDPMEIFVERVAEKKTFSAHIPFNASIGDLQSLFPRLEPELHFEKIRLKESKDLNLSSMTDAATSWHFSHGKTIPL